MPCDLEALWSRRTSWQRTMWVERTHGGRAGRGRGRKAPFGCGCSYLRTDFVVLAYDQWLRVLCPPSVWDDLNAPALMGCSIGVNGVLDASRFRWWQAAAAPCRRGLIVAAIAVGLFLVAGVPGATFGGSSASGESAGDSGTVAADAATSGKSPALRRRHAVPPSFCDVTSPQGRAPCCGQ